jgi:hypothetical protein
LDWTKDSICSKFSPTNKEPLLKAHNLAPSRTITLFSFLDLNSQKYTNNERSNTSLMHMCTWLFSPDQTTHSFHTDLFVKILAIINFIETKCNPTCSSNVQKLVCSFPFTNQCQVANMVFVSFPKTNHSINSYNTNGLDLLQPKYGFFFIFFNKPKSQI